MSKQCTEIRSYDHMPVSQGYKQAQYPLLMASHTHWTEIHGWLPSHRIGYPPDASNTLQPPSVALQPPLVALQVLSNSVPQPRWPRLFCVDSKKRLVSLLDGGLWGSHRFGHHHSQFLAIHFRQIPRDKSGHAPVLVLLVRSLKQDVMMAPSLRVANRNNLRMSPRVFCWGALLLMLLISLMSRPTGSSAAILNVHQASAARAQVQISPAHAAPIPLQTGMSTGQPPKCVHTECASPDPTQHVALVSGHLKMHLGVSAHPPQPELTVTPSSKLPHRLAAPGRGLGHVRRTPVSYPVCRT